MTVDTLRGRTLEDTLEMAAGAIRNGMRTVEQEAGSCMIKSGWLTGDGRGCRGHLHHTASAGRSIRT